MPEGVSDGPSRVDSAHDFMLFEAGKRCFQFRVVEGRDAAQQVVGEFTTDDRGHLRHGSSPGRQVEPRHQRVAQGLGYRPGGARVRKPPTRRVVVGKAQIDGATREFLDEQRYGIAFGDHAFHHDVGDGACPQGKLGHLGHVASPEAGDGQRADVAIHGQMRPVLGTVGHDQKDLRLADLAGQQIEKLLGGRIDPLRVFQNA